MLPCLINLSVPVYCFSCFQHNILINWIYIGPIEHAPPGLMLGVYGLQWCKFLLLTWNELRWVRREFKDNYKISLPIFSTCLYSTSLSVWSNIICICFCFWFFDCIILMVYYLMSNSTVIILIRRWYLIFLLLCSPWCSLRDYNWCSICSLLPIFSNFCTS